MNTSIFKYFRGDSNSLKTIKHKYLWFSKPPYLNDPFDCSMEHLVSRDSQLSELGKKFIRKNTKEFGICCFTEDPLNLYMWSHYGNSYHGVCVEFDFKAIQDFCSVKFQADCDLIKCNYRIDPLDLEDTIDWIHKDGRVSMVPLRKILSCDSDSDKLFKMLLLQKNKRVWENEKEWRIILGGLAIRNGAKNYAYMSKGYKIPLPENAIKSIVIGPKMEKSNKETIEFINRKVYFGNLEIKVIEMDHNSWSLELKKS